jgi:hypothetical protein
MFMVSVFSTREPSFGMSFSFAISVQLVMVIPA